LVLLLVGCGGHAIAAGTNPGSPSVGFTSTPPLESTGPQSTSPGGGSGGGGPAVYIPGLPIGTNTGSSNGGCPAFQWLEGTPIPPGVTVTITSVVVVQGDLTTVSAAAAGCTGAVCQGFQFNAANRQYAHCYVPVQYTGSSPPSPNGVPGSLRFNGELSCPNVDLTTCQQYSGGMTPTPQVPFTYYPPTSPGSGSPGSGSP
jgi:hypothetical protein